MSYHEGRNYVPKNNHKGKHTGPYGGKHEKGCCSMVAAIRSAKDGNYRLAARYVRMTPRYLARRFA